MEGRKKHMTSKRSLHGNARRLGIANLTDQDNVGILTEEGTQGRREGQPDFPIHLHLG